MKGLFIHIYVLLGALAQGYPYGPVTHVGISYTGNDCSDNKDINACYLPDGNPGSHCRRADFGCASGQSVTWKNESLNVQLTDNCTLHVWEWRCDRYNMFLCGHAWCSEEKYCASGLGCYCPGTPMYYDPYFSGCHDSEEEYQSALDRLHELSVEYQYKHQNQTEEGMKGTEGTESTDDGSGSGSGSGSVHVDVPYDTDIITATEPTPNSNNDFWSLEMIVLVSSVSGCILLLALPNVCLWCNRKRNVVVPTVSDANVFLNPLYNNTKQMESDL